MAQLVKSQQVQVTTSKGECHITLDINITLNHQGLIQQVGVDATEATMIDKKEKKDPEEEKFKWEIPDFEDGPSEKIDFGK